MSTAKKTTFKFSEDELQLMEELKEAMGARNMVDVVRRSLVQSSVLQKQADEDGNIRIQTAKGETLIYPTKW